MIGFVCFFYVTETSEGRWIYNIGSFLESYIIRGDKGEAIDFLETTPSKKVGLRSFLKAVWSNGAIPLKSLASTKFLGEKADTVLNKFVSTLEVPRKKQLVFEV